MSNFLRTLRQTSALVGGERRWRWFVLVGLAVVMTGLEAAGALLIYALLGLVAAPDSSVELPLVGDLQQLFPDLGQQSFMLAVAGLVGVFFVLRALFLIGQAYVRERIVHNVGATLATRLVRGYLGLPYLFHTQRNSATLVRNTFDSVKNFTTYVLTPFVALFAESVLVAGLLAVLLWLSPAATSIAIVALGGLVWGLLLLVQPRLKRLGRQAQEARSGSLQALQQSLGGIRDIRLLRREQRFASEFSRQRHELARAEYLNGAFSELPRALIEVGLVIVIVVVFAVAVLAGDGTANLLSTLGLFAYVSWRLLPSLRNVVTMLNSIKYSTAVVEDLIEDLELSESVDLVEPATADQDGAELTATIEIEDVTFAYGPDAPPVLREVSLTIHKGETIGICGPTGGGKSTLVDLLVGLLEPSSGSIAIDGVPLGRSPGWWYDQLGVVSQDVFMLDDTLRRNVAFGVPDENIDEARLDRSIARAQLDEVVREMPSGLDTVVGERGARLSGGQRQRVSVARALYREPAVIVLDEGTSALDGATETALIAAIDELKQGRTLIAVAHRLATVRRADRILVIDAGRIVADGTYDELFEGSELFRTLAH